MNSMALLAMESSGRQVGAALWGPNGLIAERKDAPGPEGRRHGSALAPLAQDLLKGAGLKPRDLAGIGVSLGPGSWTGLRVGLALAKSLAWGAGVPLVGVPSFEALALQASRNAQDVFQLLLLRNAHSEGFFTALFECAPNTAPKRVIQDQVKRAVPLSELIHGLDKSKRIVVGGDEVVSKALGLDILFRKDLEEIEPAILAGLAWERLQNGQAQVQPEHIHAVSPLYLRASDPEIKLQQRKPA